MEEPLVILAAAALDCLAQAVTGAPNAPANVCYRVGAEVAHDMGQFHDLCCEGLAYVALGQTFPANESFQIDTLRQANATCAPVSWGQEFRLGIVRCVPVFHDQLTEPPTCAEWNASALQNFYDSGSLRRAVCCFRSWVRAQTGLFLGMSVIVNPQSQGNPNGGCVERNVTINVQFPNCDCA